MPIKQPDGKKVTETCCILPKVVDGECKNCGYNWEEEERWVPY